MCGSTPTQEGCPPPGGTSFSASKSCSLPAVRRTDDRTVAEAGPGLEGRQVSDQNQPLPTCLGWTCFSAWSLCASLHLIHLPTP